MTVLVPSGANLSASRYDSYFGPPDYTSCSTSLRQIEDPGLRQALDMFDRVGDGIARTLHKLGTKQFPYDPFYDARSLETGYSLSSAFADHDALLSWIYPLAKPSGLQDARSHEMTLHARSFGLIEKRERVLFELTQTCLPLVDAAQSDQFWPDRLYVDDRSSEDAVLLVEDLAARTGLPARDILTSAGIKRSSYYSWKKQGGLSHPRVASQGTLWSLAQAIEDLEEVLGASARSWILADPHRRRQLLAGQLAQLLSAASPRGDLQPDHVDRWDHLSAYGVGADHLEVPSTLPQQPRRRAKRKVISAQVRNATYRRDH